MRLEDFLARLEGVKRSADDKATARCPAHEDRNASLSVAAGDDGRILLKCFAGCETSAIVAALGIGLKDLFADAAPSAKRARVVKAPPPPPLTDEQVAAMHAALKADPWAWGEVTNRLRFSPVVIEELQLGLHLPASGRGMFVAYPYRRDGQWTFANCRTLGGAKEFTRTPAGQPTTVYQGDVLEKEGGTALLLEGERDAAAALTLGLQWEFGGNAGMVPVAMPGVEQVRMTAAALAKQELIYLATDADAPGDAAAEKLADLLGRERCRRVRFPGHKDLGDLLTAEGPDRALEIAKQAIENAEIMAPRTESPGSDAPGSSRSDDLDPGATSGTPSPVTGATTWTPVVLAGGGSTSATPGDLLAGLCETSTLPAVTLALEELAKKARTATATERVIERERAVAAVSRVKVVSSAAKVVDTFLYAAPATESKGVAGDDVEPSPEPQSTAELLGDLVEAFDRHLVLPAGASTVLAGWVLHTWVLDAADYTPRIALTSPAKRCGKSTVLAVLRALCRRPIMAASVSAAVFYRAVEALRPSLLVDEADRFLSDSEELIGVVNAGYERNGSVLRCHGDDLEPKAFACFAPVAIAAIGTLPGTILDRALVVRMARKGRGEAVSRFDRRSRAALASFPPRLARWSEDHQEHLEEIVPEVPESLNDRERDISEPLIAIAELAGGTWPARMREAVLALCKASEADAADVRERLLAAVWQVFESSGSAFVTAKQVVAELTKDDASEWTAVGRQEKPITTRVLGKWLAGFGLKSSQPRSAGQDRGYHRDDMLVVVRKYLAPGEGGILDRVTVSGGATHGKDGGKPDTVKETAKEPDTVKDPEKPNDLAADTVTRSRTPPSSAEKGSDAWRGVLTPEQIWSPAELAASRARAAEIDTEDAS